jgi:hypothetical protein
MAMLNMYESMTEAEVASHAMALVVFQAMEGHAQIIEQHGGPVHELRAQRRK